MVDEEEGGESSQVVSLAQSQSEGGSQSQSRMARSIRSSGASSRSRVPSRSQSTRAEVEVELSEGGDDVLSIYVTEPEGVLQWKQVISPIRALPQTPPPLMCPAPCPL